MYLIPETSTFVPPGGDHIVCAGMQLTVVEECQRSTWGGQGMLVDLAVVMWTGEGGVGLVCSILWRSCGPKNVGAITNAVIWAFSLEYSSSNSREGGHHSQGWDTS